MVNPGSVSRVRSWHWQEAARDQEDTPAMRNREGGGGVVAMSGKHPASAIQLGPLDTAGLRSAYLTMVCAYVP